MNVDKKTRPNKTMHLREIFCTVKTKRRENQLLVMDEPVENEK